VHVLTDFVDSMVLAAVIFVGPIDERRFVDVSENAMYWYFVVLSWVPIYAVIYLVPRIV
jgi:heme/copper-type cytochrome/quinol oxidase subunit 3